MERKFVFFQQGCIIGKKQYAYIIMSEAIKSKRVSMCSEPRYIRNEKMNYFHEKICKKYKKLAKLFYLTYLPHELSKYEKYIFLFNEAHPCLLNLEFINWVRKKYDIKTVLVLRNMIKNKKYPTVAGIELNTLKKVFDLIVTCEKTDSEFYKLLFLPNPFSLISSKSEKIKYDICFTGTDKGRTKILTEIAKKAKQENVKYNIRVIGKVKRNSILDYVDYLPYINIIKQDMQSNCILEVLQPGQISSTLRFEEAVCLGKKLLTNNKMIKNEKYYRPEYIQIFEKVEDIDWEFVKEKKNVDYEYMGEFSPLKFLKEIESKLNMQ